MKTKMFMLLLCAASVAFVGCKKERNEPTDPTTHDYVDLGLSVKWATCNVGATTPDGYGNYYAWGETSPKNTYNWTSYKWCNGSEATQTKYCTSSSYGTVDNTIILDPEDDIAYVSWGGDWRMPTVAEQYELRTQCAWTWTDDYNGTGVAGYIVKSKTNDNSIFLPAAGYRSEESLSFVGSKGFYWSSSLDDNTPVGACYIIFHSNHVGWNVSNRFIGQSVRPVCQ